MILFVVDGQQGLTPLDEDLARLLRRSQRPLILVVNKIDHAEARELRRASSRGSVSARALDQRRARPRHRRSWSIASRRFSRRNHTRQPGGTTRRRLSLAIVGRPNVGKSSLINAILSDGARSSRTSPAPRATPSTSPTARQAATTCSSIPPASARAGKTRLRSRSSASCAPNAASGARISAARDRCHHGRHRAGQKDRGADPGSPQALLIAVNKWDLIKPERPLEGSARRVARGNAAAAFLFTLRAGPRGLRFDRRKCRASLHRDPQNPARGAGASRHRTAQSPPARGFRREPAADVGEQADELFYATQTRGQDRPLATPEFVLFVNDPQLLGDTYARYLEAQIRAAEPFQGLPLMLNFRPRAETKTSRR